jgi:putative Mg2+ transporter-C (MgtC) family protein
MTPQEQSIVIRILVSVVAGAIIGAEREYRSKSAGFRTLILISMGSCLFTILSGFINVTEPERIAVGIVSGIGFLGAGVIFKSDNKVTGLTTAATIWITAAIGMAIGGGYYIYAGVTLVSALLVLILLTRLENFIDKVNQIRNYKIVCRYSEQELKHYEKRFKHHRLSFRRGAQSRVDNKLSGFWVVQGSEKNHEKFIAETLNDTTVTDFEF